MLGKYILLGIYKLFNNKLYIDFLNNNKEKKMLLLKILIFFLLNHRNEKIRNIDYIMKKEVENTNFLDEEEEELEVDDDIKNYNDIIELILKDNDEIIKSDEFKLFTKVMKEIKENDDNTYNEIINTYFGKDNRILERLYRYKNIKIEYEKKEYLMPRIIVKIINSKK